MFNLRTTLAILMLICCPIKTFALDFGMFSVVASPGYGPQPGTQDLRDELTDIKNGGVSYIHAYKGPDQTFWSNLLTDIHTVGGIKLIVNVGFDYFDTDNDNDLDATEEDNFEDFVDYMLSHQYQSDIGGWLICDEPSDAIPVSEMEKIGDYIDTEDSRPRLLIEQGLASQNYDRYESCYDILLIDNYAYALNNSYYGTIKWWTSILQDARGDLGAASTKDIHAVIVLGEETGDPDYLDEASVVHHAYTHATIRKLIDLDIDGIWFYAWRVGVDVTDDAVYRWTDVYNPSYPEHGEYAEIVLNEPDDIEYLVTAFSNSSYSENRIYRSNVSIGNSPGQGSVYYDSDVYASALTAGDIYGDQGDDLAFPSPLSIAGNYSNGDGDSELITGFTDPDDDPQIGISGDGTDPDEDLEDYSTYDGAVVTALASGDFDGDGDFEYVTAVQEGSACYVYLSHDGTDYDQVYYSTYYRVTAMAAGDFHGIGRDYLATSFSTSSYSDNRVYISDIGSGQSPGAGESWSNSTWYVSALAAGYFEEEDREFLAVGITTGSFTDIANNLNICDIDGDENPFSSSYNQTYPSSYGYRITALASIDWDVDNRHDRLFLATTNENKNSSAIYKIDLFDPSPSWTTTYNSAYYHITAMTAGSFEESYPGLSPAHWKIAHPSLHDSKTEAELPDSFSLSTYPNPFNPVTTFSLNIPQNTTAKLAIYSITGQHIETLFDGRILSGNHSVTFDGSNLPSGMYLYAFESPLSRISGKLLLLK